MAVPRGTLKEELKKLIANCDISCTTIKEIRKQV